MSDTAAGLLQVGLLIVLLAAVYRPLGGYMARVYTSEKHSRVERGAYKLFGVDAKAEQTWAVYARSVVAFSAVSVILLYLIQRLQHALPLSNGLPGVESGLALNTAASFVTNTNWQSYVPEVTMGHLVQFAGLAVQNFLSAAVGIVVAIAVIRGFARTKTDRLGNFWVDLTRTVIRILLPIAILGALLLVAMGVVQNFSGGHEVTSVVGQTQTLPGGPVASQEVIKELGTNGGGFYNANSAHPFENPNPLSQPVRDLPAAGDPGLPDPDLRRDGQGQAAGLRDPRRDGHALGRLRRPRDDLRGPGRGHRDPGRRRRDGGQGDPLR